MDHILYTDGGSHNNGPRKGTGSHAFLEPVDLSNDYVDIYGEYYTDTTNNRTEMLAIINGIRHIKLNDDMHLLYIELFANTWKAKIESNFII